MINVSSFTDVLGRSKKNTHFGRDACFLILGYCPAGKVNEAFAALESASILRARWSMILYSSKTKRNDCHERTVTEVSPPLCAQVTHLQRNTSQGKSGNVHSMLNSLGSQEAFSSDWHGLVLASICFMAAPTLQ